MNLLGKRGRREEPVGSVLQTSGGESKKNKLRCIRRGATSLRMRPANKLQSRRAAIAFDDAWNTNFFSDVLSMRGTPLRCPIFCTSGGVSLTRLPPPAERVATIYLRRAERKAFSAGPRFCALCAGGVFNISHILCSAWV